MLSTTDPHHVMPGAASDTPADVPRPAPAPMAPQSGRALLAVLEQMAQVELAGMVGVTVAKPPMDPALALLGWDLGLSGAEIAGSESTNVT